MVGLGSPSPRRLGTRLLLLVVTAAVALASTAGLAAAQDESQAPLPQREYPPTAPKVHPPEDGGDTAPQIVNGSPAGTFNFPWMAALMHTIEADPYNAQFCGGTLIDPEWILTAAHCMEGETVATVQAAFGWDDLDDIPPGDRLTISQILIHPSYLPATLEFDFALLKLATPLTGRPTAAWSVDAFDAPQNLSAVVLGWGIDQTGFRSDTLQGAVARVLQPPTNPTCGTWPLTQYHVNSQICVGQSLSGGLPATCDGDDGGPLVSGSPGGWKLIGLVSTGPAPCGNQNPDIYARLSAAAGFIEDNLGEPTSQGTLHSIPPVRILDTRFNTGALASGYVGGQATINPQVEGMIAGGVPFGQQANAVVLNLAATQPGANGWLTAYPTGTALPTAANINFRPGQTVANLVTVQLGQGGKISITNSGGNAQAGGVHIVADVVGWYSNNDSGAFWNNAEPKRLVDTRSGTPDNAVNTPVDQASPITVNVCGGTTGIPPTATSVVVNAAAIGSSTAGWLTLWPTGPPPEASNVNYGPFVVASSLSLVKVGPACTIQVGNSPGAPPGTAAPINVVIDVISYYGIEGVVSGARFHARPPIRIVDTRFGAPANQTILGPVPPNGTIEPVARGGATGVPTSAAGLVVNMTAVQPATYGWLTIYPQAPLPAISSLNFFGGEVVPNLATVAIGADGRVRVSNSAFPGPPTIGAGPVHVVLDVSGWFE